MYDMAKKQDITRARETWKLYDWDDVREKFLADPETRREYDKLEVKFSIIRAIIKKRAQEKLTQKELAHKIGMTQSALARFESGAGNPTISSVQKIAEALDLKVKIVPA